MLSQKPDRELTDDYQTALARLGDTLQLMRCRTSNDQQARWRLYGRCIAQTIEVDALADEIIARKIAKRA